MVVLVRTAPTRWRIGAIFRPDWVVPEPGGRPATWTAPAVVALDRVRAEIKGRDDRLGSALIIPKPTEPARRGGLLGEPRVEGEPVDEGDSAVDETLHEA